MTGAAAARDDASVEPAALRDVMLSGRHSKPEIADLGDDLAAFLGRDAGALTRWFGEKRAFAFREDQSGLRGLVERDLVAIDRLLSSQLDAILHHPRFQALEGRWRGLAWLVLRFEVTVRLKFMLLVATWREIERDVNRTSEFDQSTFFRLVYENEFGQAGGEPFGLLVMDQEVRHRPARRRPGDPAPVDDVSVLNTLSGVAAAAFVPMVFAASPALFAVDRFEDLILSHDVTGLMNGQDYARWRALTSLENARFLCATMPRILARERWSAHLGSLWYREHAPSVQERPWFVAGYAFAAVVGRAHVEHEWPADIRGVNADRVGGGLVVDLPTDDFVFGAETRAGRASTELGLTDRQERDLVLSGFIPLNTLPHGETAFTSVHSLQSRRGLAPGQDPTPAHANRRISAQISSMLCVSRFAHYVKIIGRDLTGTLLTPGDIERRLQNWLMGYTNSNISTTPDSRARAPLVSSAVQVRDIPGRPGAYSCVIHLQPYYQLDDIATTFRLVTDFGSPGANA